MSYDRESLAAKMEKWGKSLGKFRLPAWEEIPDLGLYMDQVTLLLTGYLGKLSPEGKDEKVITPAAINNYVRMRVMPEPSGKKYYRAHLAYLIMICTLKGSLSIATLGKLIPAGLDEDRLREIYADYAEAYRCETEAFSEQVKTLSGEILGEPEPSGGGRDIRRAWAASAAVSGGFSVMLAEKLLSLEDGEGEDGAPVQKKDGQKKDAQKKDGQKK